MKYPLSIQGLGKGVIYQEPGTISLWLWLRPLEAWNLGTNTSLFMLCFDKVTVGSSQFLFSWGVPKLSKCVFKSLLLGLKMSFFLRKVIFWVLNVPKGGGVIDLGTIPQRRCLCLGRDSNGDAFA